MKVRLRFQAPFLSDLLSGDHSDEDIQEITKLYQTFFHKGNPEYLVVSFDTKREEAKVVMPKKE